MAALTLHPGKHHFSRPPKPLLPNHPYMTMKGHTMQVDQHRERTREETGAELGRRILGTNNTAEWAVLAVDLDNLTSKQLARPDLPADRRPFWEALAEIADTGTGDLPKLPSPAPDTKLSEPAPTVVAPRENFFADMLCAAEKEDLRAIACEVPYFERGQLVLDFEMEVASGGSLVLLDEAERAAARLLLDDRRHTEHLNRLAKEIDESQTRLAQMAEKGTTTIGAPYIQGF